MSRRKKYLKLLQKSFNEEEFVHFVIDLLNLNHSDLNSDLKEEMVDLKQYKDDIHYYKFLARYNDGLNDIGVFIVNLKSTESRSLQRNFVGGLLNRFNLDASIVAFYSPNQSTWRLSVVKKEVLFTEKGIKQDLTPAKRYSYLVGENEAVHTAKKYLLKLLKIDDRKVTLSDIENVFSVEKVTKEFFEEYKERYLLLKEYLDSNKYFVSESEKYDFNSSEFAKKLMGQIVFLYFLQKKGWLGVSLIPEELTVVEYNNIYSKNDEVSQSLLESFYSLDDNLYNLNLKKIQTENNIDVLNLSNLFVNSEHDKPWGSGKADFIRYLFEQADESDVNFFEQKLEPFFYSALNENRENQYFPLFNSKVPFLNGGLFEPLNNYRWYSSHFKIPNNLFSNSDKTGILDFLDLYNFTIDEEEPLEKDIAVDPEMLGKIFENLLDVDDRKSKGAFYTPREIVYYMCQESLANYLVNKLSIDLDEITDFIKHGDLISQSDTSKYLEGDENFIIGDSIYDNIAKIDEALIDIKIADPAVGSGAFPLGILTQIVNIRTNLTPYLYWQSKKRLIPKELLFTGKQSKRDLYSMKLQTIENSIYAVDIDISAIDIAKLRLWLSLIVDYPNNKSPKPLPNLDFKIQQGNSLLDEYKGVELFSEKMLENNLKNYKRNKSSIKEVDAINMQQVLFGEEKDLNEYITKMLELQKEFFITFDNRLKKELKYKIDEIQKDLVRQSLVNDRKKLKEFEKLSHKRIKPWFIWQLEFFDVFKSNGGFDIIIGNPPYIKERDNKDIFEEVKKSSLGKKWYQGKMDFWYFFLHISIDYINSNGCISFITPRYWLNSEGAKKLIDRIEKDLSIISMTDIGNLKVFDNVLGYHMISSYQKKPLDKFKYVKISNTLSDLNSDFNTENISISYKLKSDVITSNNEILLDGDFNNYDNTVNLGDVCDISQGVIEASDKISNKMVKKYPKDNIFVGQGIFVLTKQEVNALNLTPLEHKMLKKYISGVNINKYSLSFSDNYLIYADSNFTKELKEGKYPNLKKHLKFMEKYITSSNKPYGLHRPRNKRFFENKKIICPSMFKEPSFAIDYKNNYYVGMSCNSLIQKDSNYELEYILGILNSDFAKDWFNNNGKKRGAGVDIGVTKLRSFPIKKASPETKDKIKTYVLNLQKNYSEKEQEKLNDTIRELYNEKEY